MFEELEEIKYELTKLLIKQKEDDRKAGNKKQFIMTQEALYKTEIEFIKFIQNYLQNKCNSL